MKKEEKTNTENKASIEHPVGVTLEAEIDEAITADLERDKMLKEETETDTKQTDVTPVKTEVETVPVEEEKKAVETEKIVVDDSLLERAVKSGMTLATAKTFADSESLLQVVGVLESKQSPKSKDGDPPEEEEELSIPDLEDEDTAEADRYDPKLVSVVKSMKAMLLAQSDEIKHLKAGGMAPGGKSWFDSKVEALGEAYKDSLGVGEQSPKFEQKDARSKVKTKFDVLTAGYKSAKVEMSSEDVLSEALKMVVGDVDSVASDVAKKTALSDRKKLNLQRPSPVDGKTGKKSTEEIERGIAEEIDVKYFHK